MILSSNQFTFKNNVFTAFASDVEYGFKQIYPDACDVGFEMLSDRTGHTVKFALNDTTEDGYVMTFKPLREEVRKNPRLAGISVKVFNT